MKKTDELIGNTPVIEAGRFFKAEGIEEGRLLVKLERYSLSGSIKHRIALAMIELAEKNGELKPDATIVESSSGNTGIGLAAVGASKDYRLVLTMPDMMSVERRALLQ